ncbi:DUF397 domain-containing protein [Streptomyces sp. NPDC037389]|uniref:DUF397 domain-containing protein n=1 Tax=Streptomyces sp. NPDC037389 TaxID=3155369 RepID=UPI0033E5A2A0
MSKVAWQKSTYSASTPGNECVEVSAANGGIRLRESDAPGTVIVTAPPALAALIWATKAGRMDI